jgi:hypothetical protein
MRFRFPFQLPLAECKALLSSKPIGKELGNDLAHQPSSSNLQERHAFSGPKYPSDFNGNIRINIKARTEAALNERLH